MRRKLILIFPLFLNLIWTRKSIQFLINMFLRVVFLPCNLTFYKFSKFVGESLVLKFCPKLLNMLLWPPCYWDLIYVTDLYFGNLKSGFWQDIFRSIFCLSLINHRCCSNLWNQNQIMRISSKMANLTKNFFDSLKFILDCFYLSMFQV